MSRRRLASRGLTAPELFIFLSLACLLVSVGMVAASKYLRQKKAAEAVALVTTLGHAGARYFNESDSSQPAGTDPGQARATRHFPPSSTQSVPADPLDVRGKDYQSAPADWAVSPWHELRFSIPQAQHHAYSFVSEGAGASARASALATGDLNADGHASRFEAVIRPDDHMEAAVDPFVRRTDPDE